MMETPEEIAEKKRRMNEIVVRFFEELTNDICPHCHVKLTGMQQIGRCVYGSCGHRLYQGKVPKHFKKQ